MDFDEIKETAAHEVAHLVSKRHGERHQDAISSLQIRTWRPPGGVAWIKPGKKMKESKGEKHELPPITESLEELTVNELRQIAKGKNLSGYSSKKKAELIDMIVESEKVEIETGHDLTTRIINHYLGKIKKKFKVSGRSAGAIETVQTGGLMEIRKKEEKYRYPSWVVALEKWRNHINEEYLSTEIGESEIKSIFKNLCSNLYWEVLRGRGRVREEDREYWLDRLNELVLEVEQETDNEGIFREALEETGIFHILNITVKPWISLSGIANARIEIRDEFDLFPKEGRTDSDGRFRIQVLAGKVKVYVKTENDEKVEYLDVDEEEDLTIHPSIF